MTQLSAPYKRDEVNLIYNLLFCDEPALYARGQPDPTSDLAKVVEEKSSEANVRRIVEDCKAEGRIRALGARWLRRHGFAVQPKLLFGVIVEVPLDGGLDTLAAFSDGGVRYINQSGKMGFFEPAPETMMPIVSALLAAGQAVVGKIGPWDKERLPPPPNGSVRLSFLVSDGLYFGQGTFENFARDAMAGPVLQQAQKLLLAVTAMATGKG